MSPVGCYTETMRMASWLYFLRKVAALSTEGRERLEIGGASGHSHSGAGLSSDWGAGSHSQVSDGIALEEVSEAGAEFTVEPPWLHGAAPFRPGLACRQPHHPGRSRLLFIARPVAATKGGCPEVVRI
jgi:hypothetical protein